MTALIIASQSAQADGDACAESISNNEDANKKCPTACGIQIHGEWIHNIWQSNTDEAKRICKQQGMPDGTATCACTFGG